MRDGCEEVNRNEPISLRCSIDRKLNAVDQLPRKTFPLLKLAVEAIAQQRVEEELPHCQRDLGTKKQEAKFHKSCVDRRNFGLGERQRFFGCFRVLKSRFWAVVWAGFEFRG